MPCCAAAWLRVFPQNSLPVQASQAELTTANSAPKIRVSLLEPENDMPASVTAQVTPAMLRWAREQAGCSLEQAGRSAGKDAVAVAAWESPTDVQLPTVRQAQSLARAYRVPLTVFYLDRPFPELEKETVPEFRGLDPDSGGIRPQSRQLRWMIRQAQDRQALAVELSEYANESFLPWVGSASLHEDPELLGAQICQSLGVNGNIPRIRDMERILDWWVERVESIGAFVSRYRPDGNQYWFVEPSEARGLSLCHPLAPLIVLNSRDAPAGRIFTLMHELAHIYYGQCGLDDLKDERLVPQETRILEQRCNRVAAAILMPSAHFQREWASSLDDLPDRIRRLAEVFGVSRQAVAVRARSSATRFLSEAQYDHFVGLIDEEYREFRQTKVSGGNGGMAPSVRVLKEFGGKFTGLLFDAHAEGRLNRLDLSDALDARLKDIEGIRDRLHLGRSR